MMGRLEQIRKDVSKGDTSVTFPIRDSDQVVGLWAAPTKDHTREHLLGVPKIRFWFPG
jgi:hypothetical protein